MEEEEAAEEEVATVMVMEVVQALKKVLSHRNKSLFQQM